MTYKWNTNLFVSNRKMGGDHDVGKDSWDVRGRTREWEISWRDHMLEDRP